MNLSKTNQECSHSGCKARRLADSESCIFHDPRYADQGKAAREKGGRNSHRRFKPPESVEDCRQLLGQTAIGMLTGKIPSRRGQPIIAALRAVLHCFELGELKRASDLLEGKSKNGEPNG